jgi:hypothetical protein
VIGLRPQLSEPEELTMSPVVARATFKAASPDLSAYWKASFPSELPARDRDNPRTLWHCARTAVGKRDQAA